MTALQAALLGLAVLSVLWQVLKVAQLTALVARYRVVRIRASLYAMALLTTAVEVAFVLSLTGVSS